MNILSQIEAAVDHVLDEGYTPTEVRLSKETYLAMLYEQYVLGGMYRQKEKLGDPITYLSRVGPLPVTRHDTQDDFKIYISVEDDTEEKDYN